MSLARAGIHLVHKPVGVSSFQFLKSFTAGGALGGLKSCHGGTLDPFAAGLLLVLAGPATRLMDRLHAVPKTYLATVVWGMETDAGDGLGRPVAEGDPSQLTPAILDQALTGFLGWQEQVPPATSAKKINGEPAYRRVHRGETVVLPPSRVFLHSARWRSHALPHESVLELTCRGGYYVRALARDLGRRVGARAHLSGLTRTAIGPWQDPPEGSSSREHGTGVLPWAPVRHVTPDERRALKSRGSIPVEPLEAPRWEVPTGFPDPEPPVLGAHQGRVFALLERGKAGLRSTVWLAPEL